MSKKDIVNMIVETYSAQSKADKDFLDLHAPIITTHYSPDYPEMDDILTARHFNTYVRREHGRNHPVAGEAFSKANQTRQAMYNQDHGYMPGEDSNYSYPHPHSLSEDDDSSWVHHVKRVNEVFWKIIKTTGHPDMVGQLVSRPEMEDAGDSNHFINIDNNKSLNEGKRWDAFKKNLSSDLAKKKKDWDDATERDHRKQMQKGKMSADTYWEKHKHGTYHAADGNHYHYRRTVTNNSDGSQQHQLHVRKVGSKSSTSETFHVNKDWSNEQGMRHHKGPSHIDHMYSDPSTKPKLDMNEMIMLRPHPHHDMMDNFPHINPFNDKRKKPSLKTPAIDPNTDQLISNVAKYLKTDAKIVAETMIDRPNTGNDFPQQGSSKPKPKDNSGKVWKPNIADTKTKPPTDRMQPMTEERFVIKYVLKGTLEEGETKPWSDPDKAVAYAHKMFASQLYEEVEVVKDVFIKEGWRHVHAVTGAAKGFTTGLGKGILGGGLAGAAAGLAFANPVGGAIAGAGIGGVIGSSQDATKGFMKGYDKGREMDFHNAKKKYENSRDTYGKDHPVTLKHLDHMRKLSG
jgi:hypothetical protein